MAIPLFSDNILRQLANLLEGAATHRELSGIFSAAGIAECGGQPKWERILLALSQRQASDRCGNNVGAFIQTMMDPVRFVRRDASFDEMRVKLNTILAFCGLQLGTNGRLHAVSHAQTLSEAQERASRLRSELTRRGVHHDVLAFCRAELLEQNFFHAILEATKSVADKLRSKTGLQCDGAELVDTAFKISHPLLALNTLVSESEQSEQKGFGNLLKGMFGMFRNPTAHAPKVRKSYTEEEALDLLTLVSFMHRTIDAATRTPFPTP